MQYETWTTGNGESAHLLPLSHGQPWFGFFHERAVFPEESGHPSFECLGYDTRSLRETSGELPMNKLHSLGFTSFDILWVPKFRFVKRLMSWSMIVELMVEERTLLTSEIHCERWRNNGHVWWRSDWFARGWIDIYLNKLEQIPRRGVLHPLFSLSCKLSLTVFHKCVIGESRVELLPQRLARQCTLTEAARKWGLRTVHQYFPQWQSNSAASLSLRTLLPDCAAYCSNPLYFTPAMTHPKGLPSPLIHSPCYLSLRPHLDSVFWARALRNRIHYGWAYMFSTVHTPSPSAMAMRRSGMCQWPHPRLFPELVAPPHCHHCSRLDGRLRK